MPSHSLLPQLAPGFHVDEDWRIDGSHDQRTLESWLKLQDLRRDEIMPILQAHVPLKLSRTSDCTPRVPAGTTSAGLPMFPRKAVHGWMLLKSHASPLACPSFGPAPSAGGTTTLAFLICTAIKE